MGILGADTDIGGDTVTMYERKASPDSTGRRRGFWPGTGTETWTVHSVRAPPRKRRHVV